MDRGPWWITVHGVAKSQTRLSDSHVHFYFFLGPLCRWSQPLHTLPSTRGDVTGARGFCTPAVVSSPACPPVSACLTSHPQRPTILPPILRRPPRNLRQNTLQPIQNQGINHYRGHISVSAVN